MFENHNIISFIFTFLPVLIYSIIVFVSMPVNIIKFKIASLFFFMGVLSTILVNTVHYTFPNWDFPMNEDPIIALFLSSFFKIGLLEESSKYILYRMTEWYRGEKVLHPNAIMFYSMSVSCGFAVSENILYAQIYGGNVLFIRSVSSVLIHMICGLTIGYFIAIGKKYNRITLLSFVGIIVATLYHALYDFNIFVNGDSGIDKSFFIIVFGLIGSYAMSNDLFTYYKKEVL